MKPWLNLYNTVFVGLLLHMLVSSVILQTSHLFPAGTNKEGLAEQMEDIAERQDILNDSVPEVCQTMWMWV
jgi:hypothetical protein